MINSLYLQISKKKKIFTFEKKKTIKQQLHTSMKHELVFSLTKSQFFW